MEERRGLIGLICEIEDARSPAQSKEAEAFSYEIADLASTARNLYADKLAWSSNSVFVEAFYVQPDERRGLLENDGLQLLVELRTDENGRELIRVDVDKDEDVLVSRHRDSFPELAEAIDPAAAEPRADFDWPWHSLARLERDLSTENARLEQELLQKGLCRGHWRRNGTFDLLTLYEQKVGVPAVEWVQLTEAMRPDVVMHIKAGGEFYWEMKEGGLSWYTSLWKARTVYVFFAYIDRVQCCRDSIELIVDHHRNLAFLIRTYAHLLGKDIAKTAEGKYCLPGRGTPKDECCLGSFHPDEDEDED